MSDPTVSSVGEFGLIDLVTSELVPSPFVSVGVGDDAAVFRLDNDGVCSTDTIVEGVHFRRDWSSATEVGRKAIAQAAADLEAMAARPRLAVVAVSLPKDLPLTWAVECMSGVRSECDRAGLTLVGGDTTASRDITLAVTVIGDLGGRQPVLRSGAAAGDVVAIRGRLGWSAAGLAVLMRGFRSPRAVVDAYRVPEIPYGQGLVAAQAGATAMLDVSDGLIADLRHIADASDVAINIDSSALVVAEPIVTVATALGTDPLQYVLTGGEDHALAACFPPGSVPEGWEAIGSVSVGPAGVLLDGGPLDAEGGWNHFA